MLDPLYRHLVMDHAKYRRNHGALKGEGVHHLYYKNPTCRVMTSVLELFSGGIKDISFVGEGWSISILSCSMMTDW
ncbi:iron-sulfur cluster assembly scaffold protein [Alteribacillus sp. JSM 102045]|uniref:iron-sulfur cluster assembly scaffold protein n=1 Tax=Alteribacillus sp. JSM 102045 TaxID=1562101 RepID=UPI0035BECE7D